MCVSTFPKLKTK